MNPLSDQSPARFPSATPQIELTIDRLVIDAPPGVRPEALRAEIERHLHAELTARASAPLLSAHMRETIVGTDEVSMSRHPAIYAARIASSIAKGIWP